MLRYRFKTIDRKPRPQSQSYIGPTTVGPDFKALHSFVDTWYIHVHTRCMIVHCIAQYINWQNYPNVHIYIVTKIYNVNTCTHTLYMYSKSDWPPHTGHTSHWPPHTGLLTLATSHRPPHTGPSHRAHLTLAPSHWAHLTLAPSHWSPHTGDTSHSPTCGCCLPTAVRRSCISFLTSRHEESIRAMSCGMTCSQVSMSTVFRPPANVSYTSER